MALDLWTTAEMIELQQDTRLAPPDGFWSGIRPAGAATSVTNLNVFDREVRSESRLIYFNKLPLRDRRVAPFVAPNVQGRVIRRRGTEMASFAPAYLKPKHEISMDQTLVRRPGEPYGPNPGSKSLEERFDEIVTENLRTEREMIERRWDVMASQAIIYGQVTVVGEDYPRVTVDFKRDPSLTYILAGGARWDQASADPLANLKTARTNAFNLSQSPVKRLVFGTKAWSLFIEDEKVQKLLDNQSRASNSQFAGVDLGTESPVEYKGFISAPDGGRIDMWVYSNAYEDENGDMQQYLDPRDVVGVGANLQGIRCFGAIQDKRAGLKALPMFPKMWDEEDPSETFTMTQSAPLFVIGNPNNGFRIRVTDAL